MTYTIQNSIGDVKYAVSFYDGTKKHKDGSDFYDIKLFSNKKKLNNFVKELAKKGYREA